ncbi:SCO family protein [bacterium]|jgi:protein SCO1/2|nr:SCO family protein [bacterium]NBW56575.1 SCO family protein [bacterium]NBX72484.1 SCO family protein [bacterium]
MKLRWIAVFIIVIALFFSHAQIKRTQDKKPEVLSLPTGSVFQSQQSIPEIVFLNQDGQDMKREDFLNHWSLFFFGYTACPEFCPIIVQAMDRIGRSFQGDNLKFYFVSIDPHHDKPHQLKDFLSQYKTPIIGLNGSLDQVAALAEFFKLTVEKAEGQERHIEHSASLVLVDPSGRPVGLFSDYKNPKQIALDIRYAQYYLKK